VSTWFVGAGVLSEPPETEAQTLDEALKLRESLFTFIKHLIDAPDDPLPRADLDVINRAAAYPPPTIALEAEGRLERDGSWRAGLSAVARDGLALIDIGDAQLKWCADPDCTHPFLDHSHGHRRRWCEMAACGDRAKAKAYRARRRATTSSD
jgi:predicted RNA-binding Zn ribbon-like protein